MVRVSYTRAQVVAAARRCFPGAAFTRAMQALDGQKPVPGWMGGYERLHLAILKLSNGDFAQLLYYIEAAQRDYRDLLWWAEYPPGSNVPLPDPYGALCGDDDTMPPDNNGRGRD